MSESPDLHQLRQQIEEADRELLQLLARRMGLAESVAHAKLAQASPFRDPRREEQVLGRVRQLAREAGLDPHAVERLFQLIMEMSLARQYQHVQSLSDVPLRVAYQGVEGAFSHIAAQSRYAGRRGGALLTGYETFRAAAEAVRDGAADLALLPIENTTAGSINETYEILGDTQLVITGEVVSAIQHCLLGIEGARMEELERVLSHPQALRQCEAFLRKLPWVKAEPAYNTAGAASKVREMGNPRIAAIASEAAARRYGLTVLKAIPNEPPGNFTRFVEISREPQPCPKDAACKTSLTLVLQDAPGALARVLERLAARGLSLTKLESRPLVGSPFQYRFYVDLAAQGDAPELVQALDELRPLLTELRVLGTYPRAELPVDGKLLSR